MIYLIFNEGYGGRVDLEAEAIRLGRLLASLMPDEPEVHGLLALMLLHDARRMARFSGEDLVLMPDQDRSKWDAAQIEEGRALLDRALARLGRGPYVLQAAIASLQMEDPPDWREIAALYGELVRLTGSAVAELNRAVAVAEIHGPDAALRILDRLGLHGYQYFHSTRAELLRRLGRAGEAAAAYGRALELARAGPERRFLTRRLEEVRSSSPRSTASDEGARPCRSGSASTSLDEGPEALVVPDRRPRSPSWPPYIPPSQAASRTDPARRRALLAAETASVLEESVPAVSSALQRARATQALPRHGGDDAGLASDEERPPPTLRGGPRAGRSWRRDRPAPPGRPAHDLNSPLGLSRDGRDASPPTSWRA